MRPFDAQGMFHPIAGDHGEVRRLAVRGAGANVTASGLMLVIQMVSTVVLARLLAPSDFGVVAMVTTFSLLVMNFGLNGFTEAVVQTEEISQALTSNLFWINLGASLLLTIAFAAAGSLLAWFYGDPRVTMVSIGVSLTIFITGASVLHLALLKRAMEFPAIAVINIIARVVSIAVSIILALMGWGYWALVIGTVALPLCTSAGAFILCPWVPGLPRRVAGTAKLVRFAINVYGHFTVNYFARNMDNVLVGWRFGAGPLGFYKKAYDLFALSSNQLVSPLAVVAVAALSRLKDDAAQYRRYFLRSLALLAFVGMGVGADLCLVGKDLIRVVLGPGWDEAGRIFVFFGPGIGVMLLYYTHGWIHLSIGTANRWFRWGMIEFGVTALLFILGLAWGPVGIAMAWTVSFWVLMLPSFWYAGQPIGFGIRPVLATIWRYITASVLAGLASAWVVWHSHPFGTGEGIGDALARMTSVSLMFTALYLIAVVALFRSLEPVSQLVKLLPDMVLMRRSPKPAPAAAAATGELSGGAVLSMTGKEAPETGGR
ncbi:MAG: lipopolysaccharide biosynthesis protein [Acidobacteria bacterium]|nr:MAG: lipopolysaccharide biosynthesis protein [Acidobacteriota bacterium]